jgi:hypothetical protein
MTANSLWSWVGWVCRRGLGTPCLYGRGFLDADNLGLHPWRAAVYLTNVERLALHLEGNPDAPQAVIAAAVTKTGYKGYVAPDYVAAAPAAGKPAPAPPAPAVPATAKK